MKKTVLKLIISLIIFAELGGCSFGASMQAQYTSMNIGCNADDVQISNERVELSGAETWTAKCDGKIYDCDYFPEADSHCYLRDE